MADDYIYSEVLRESAAEVLALRLQALIQGCTTEQLLRLIYYMDRLEQEL